jgi:hypothetical protein
VKEEFAPLTSSGLFAYLKKLNLSEPGTLATVS